MEKQFVVVICGPTASGKTSLSVELAKELDSKITAILKGSRVSVTQAAILVALQYADDAGKNSGNADNLRAQLKSYLEDAAQAKSERDFYKRELERIKAVVLLGGKNCLDKWKNA